MKSLSHRLTKTLLMALTLALGASPAFAGDPTTTGDLATPANRIVGTWRISAQVDGANCRSGIPGPLLTVDTYLMFHAGGTVTELPRIPVSNIPAPRTFGIGTWYYDKANDAYYGTLRFDWYANGIRQGYNTVDREMRLEAGADSMSGSAVAVRFLENGTEVFSQCGPATGRRI